MRTEPITIKSVLSGMVFILFVMGRNLGRQSCPNAHHSNQQGRILNG